LVKRKIGALAGSLMLTCALFLTAAPVAGAEPFGVSSASAILYEPAFGQVLYEKDIHTPRPMASTTKIMTALLGLEKCAPDTEITVPDAAVRVEGTALGLRGGDKITMVDLITGLLLVSGNDAANVVAYTVSGSIPAFAEEMNRRAAEIGMKDTTFVTPSGLDEGEHSSSAYDMALLAAEAMKNETFTQICQKQNAVIRFGNPVREVSVHNHNKLLALYDDAVGIKTGFTKKSGRCLVSAAVRDGVTLIAVTLKAGDDWNDHISMYEYGFQQVKAVAPPAAALPALPVAGGTADEVTVTAEAPPAFPLPAGSESRVRAVIEAPQFLLAPVEAGQQVGTVRYLLDDRELCRIPLLTTDGVEARPVATYGERFIRYLKGLLAGFAG
jgi:D-alanyl-D-alanine carboxypeptidase (penicillin-binding protein 5/6)